MKKILQYSFLVATLLFAQNTFAESIENYSVEVNLQTDSSVMVTETITYDFSDLQRHGIFRFIPVTFDVEGQKHLYGLKKRKLDIDIESVSINDQSVQYTINPKDQNGNYVVKIGDPNTTITGIHTYKIKYKVDGSIRYFDEYDEIYWNAIGLDWNVPIKNANIVLTSHEIPFGQYSCYVGELSSQQKCNSNRVSTHQLFFTYENLSPREGVTVAASIGKGILPVNEITSFSLLFFIASIGGLIVAAVAGIWYTIRKYSRKHFVYDPIHPRYTPPEKLDPMFTGYIVDNTYDPRDISAGIIQLAIDGYIHIQHIPKTSWFGSDDYLFTLEKDITSLISESDFPKLFLLSILFSDFNGGLAEIRRYNFEHQRKLSEVKKVNPGFFQKKQKAEQQIKELALDADYLEESFKKISIPKVVTLFGVMIILLKVIGFFLDISISILAAILIPSSLFLLIFKMVKYRYTKKGWETKHAILGFKLFLEMTEKDRYEFHSNPADNPQQFMQYLPYAIALGVEKKWAKQFESITIDNPSWYTGSGNIAPAVFASRMSTFSKSVTSAVSTQERSGSGSGGGGFSGGGSGGGGGGSW